MPVPHLSPPYLSWLSQSTGFECLATCIEPALVIYFTNGNTHVLFICLLWAVLGLCCCNRLSLGERGLLSGCGEWASYSVASLFAEHGF